MTISSQKIEMNVFGLFSWILTPDSCLLAFKNDLTRRGNSITYTCECDLICRQEKRLDDPSSNSCTLVVVQMSQQDRGLGLVRLKFVSKRP